MSAGLCSLNSERRISFILLLLACSLLFFAAPLAAVEMPIKECDPHVANGAYALKIKGQVVRSANLEKPFIPASTIKVLTALMALETLGANYHFTTHLFVDANNVLYVRGEGDPYLTSEAVTDMARQLRRLGIDRLEAIVLDDSAFTLEGLPPGSTNTNNPYDAPSGALAVNFNALPFLVGENGRISAAEQQTPTLPLMEDIGSNLPRGSYRVNVNAYPSNPDHTNVLRYTGELFVAMFRLQGIAVASGYRCAAVPPDARPLLAFRSAIDIAELIRLCLYYSNNFIANQLYLTCGAATHGYPASWDKAERMAAEYIGRRLALPPGEIVMKDGSGLSTDNRISAAAMLTVLEQFTPYVHLLKRQQNSHVKSGTMTGVYSYVGYFESQGEYAPFVLFLNQVHNKRQVLLQLLQKEYLSVINSY